MTDLQANAKEFLEQLEGALNGLHKAFDPIRGGPPRFYFEKMTKWFEALFEKGPFKIGDKVQLIRVPEITKSSGWWGSRKTFALGVTGTVVHMDFSDGYFQADVVWDEEWVDVGGGGFNKPSHHKRRVDSERHMYRMSESSLVRYDPSHVLWVPWRGTPEQNRGEPRATIWEREVKPRLGPGSHIQPKRSRSSNFLGWVITNPVSDEAA